MKGRNTVYVQQTLAEAPENNGVEGAEVSPLGFDEVRLSVVCERSGTLILQAKMPGDIWVDYDQVGTAQARDKLAVVTGTHAAFLVTKAPCADCVRAVFLSDGDVGDGFSMCLLLLARN